MKKVIVDICFFVFLLLSLLPSHGNAQSFTSSSTHSFNSVNSTDKTLTRCWKNSAIITCSSHNTGAKSYTFQLRSLNSPDASVVGLSRTSNYYGPEEDSIYDMRISGNRCYFCGSRVSVRWKGWIMDLHGNSHYQVDYDTFGIVGYFDFYDNLTVDDNVYIYKIDKVKTAQRMLVYQPDNTNLTAIELVCLHNTSGNSPTCLVEMINTTTDPNSWSYNVVVPPNSSEILTDVVQCDWMIFTASVFSNLNSFIGFRCAKRSSIHAFGDPSSIGNELYKYNIANYGNCTTYGFHRFNDAKVRLCSRSDGFIAAVAAAPNESLDPNLVIVAPNSILLFNMYTPDNMLEYQVVDAGESLALHDIAYVKSNRSIGLLYSKKGSLPLDTIKTYLQFPRMGAVSVCNSYSDTLLWYRDGQMQTLDPLGSNSVCIGGFKWAGSSPFDGTQLQSNRLNSCFDLGGVGRITRRPTLSFKYENSPMNVIFDNEPVSRLNPQTISSETKTTIYCAN